jgi:hypothetical protein
MQSTVEAAMATEATTSINKFLQYCKTACEETVKVPTETVPIAIEAVSESVMSEDTFFDAVESYGAGEEVTQPPQAAAAVSQLPARGQPVAVAAGGHDMLLLASLRELQLSSHTTAQALADMAAQVRNFSYVHTHAYARVHTHRHTHRRTCVRASHIALHSCCPSFGLSHAMPCFAWDSHLSPSRLAGIMVLHICVYVLAPCTDVHACICMFVIVAACVHLV